MPKVNSKCQHRPFLKSQYGLSLFAIKELSSDMHACSMQNSNMKKEEIFDVALKVCSLMWVTTKQPCHVIGVCVRACAFRVCVCVCVCVCVYALTG